MYQCRVFFPSIIHNHACRVKPECLSVEPEKVGAFSCRKSDFIPVFTQTPSVTVQCSQSSVIHYLPGRTFCQTDLRMILKVRWEREEMILFVDSDQLEIFQRTKQPGAKCATTQHFISRLRLTSPLNTIYKNFKAQVA